MSKPLERSIKNRAAEEGLEAGVEAVDTSAFPEVQALAMAYYNQGLYCSEALLKAFNEVYDLGLPPNAYKIATGFGSGMGETGCACGAVTSCVMVLGLVAGRDDRSQSEALVFDGVKELQRGFRCTYKSTCCKVLTKDVVWGSKAHTAQCERIVGETAQMTQQILETQLKAYLPHGGGKKIPKKWSAHAVKRRFREAFNHHFSKTK